MKDIDFDELDRAVGSVLGTAEPKATDVSKPAVATVPEPRLAVTPSPAVSAPVTSPQPATSVSETPKIAAVAPARRRGQFLDMVHPSADMRSKSPLPTGIRKTISPLSAPTTTPRPVVHAPTHLSVEPTAVDTTPEPHLTPTIPEAQDAPVVASSNVTQDDSTSLATESASSTAETSTNDTTNWPDPLDFDSEAANETKESHGDDHDEAASHETKIETDTGNVEAAQTPFVADAKVDKRPLSAFADTDNNEAGSRDDFETETPSSYNSPLSDDAANALVPEELATDVNSVEAAGLSEANETAASGETPARATPEEVDTKPPVTHESSAAPAQATQSGASGFGQSINQQYKSATPTTDTTAHPLFDTEEYHQPLLPDGKKKSNKSLFIIILLAVLLVIGGALGYMAYTMGI